MKEYGDLFEYETCSIEKSEMMKNSDNPNDIY